MFSKLGEVLATLYAILILSVPLAIWKIIDIAVWVYNNVEVNIK